MDLKELGFNDWFEERADTSRPADHRIARIVSRHRDSYSLHDGTSEITAEITGRLAHSAESPLDYPTVGDWVYAQYFDDGAFAVIHGILPRKSILKRKTAGRRIEYQPIAANVDTAFLIQSLETPVRLASLERYLVMSNEARIRPLVLLSKSDLVPDDRIGELLERVREGLPGVEVTTFSNLETEGPDRIGARLRPGETFCLLGPSGVGKTTLLNRLVGEAAFDTQPVRKGSGKGRHTTTRRQLVRVRGGALAIDTPGMRELGQMGAESGLEQTFDEIAVLAEQCRYSDCTHTREAGCAILAALEEEEIAEDRYRSYLKLVREISRNDMSYQEKRRHDRQFGKFQKSVMKHNLKK
ncbi:MAG: ribosome small subunit-dependent GTPase A [Desulfobacterales bacterium]